MRLSLLALLLLAGLAGCMDEPAPAPEPTFVLATSAGAEPHFEPEAFRTTVGKPVPFRGGSGNHTADFALGDGPVRGIDQAHLVLAPGFESSVTFQYAGVYRFFCRYHSELGPDGTRTGMHGAILVS